MRLYNPPNLALPALKIEKKHEREEIENDPTVINLIKSKLLLDKEFNKLYLDISKKSKELLKLIGPSGDEFFFKEVYPQSRKYKYKKRYIFFNMFFMKGFAGAMKSVDKDVSEKLGKFEKIMHKDLKKHLIKLSNKIQNSISDFEGKRKKKIELSILSSMIVHVCKKCERVVSINKFKSRSCACGEKITKISRVDQIPLHYFNDKLIKFIEQNYWFEHGVDYILKRGSFQTLVGCYVLGHSGVSHEIDNIADSKSKNYRIFCECKNGEVTVNDVFIFSGKMIDAGCSRGYFFTTGEKVSNEIVRLARSKNIDIITGVLKRKVESLLEDVKEV